MPYDSIINRTDADALIPLEISKKIISSAVQQSAALTLFTQTVMSSKTFRLPVLSALPVAYFVDGDTGLKQTTDLAWDKKYLTAEEIAAFVPIPQAVLEDSAFDVFGEIQPKISEAVGRALDAAIFTGANKPASWPNDILTDATAAGNIYVRGTNDPSHGGIASDLSHLFVGVEKDGFDVNGVVANRSYRGYLRDARDSVGQLLTQVSPDSVYGVPVQYPLRGMWGTGLSAFELVAGDFTQGIIATRQDITYRILDQAVVTADDGTILYNLAQQDMVALRVVARFGFQVANPVSYDQPDETARYPFAIMNSPSS